MRIRSFEIEATPAELDTSTVLSELLARLTGQPVAEADGDDRPVAPANVEADDAAAEQADAEAAETPGPDTEEPSRVLRPRGRRPSASSLIATRPGTYPSPSSRRRLGGQASRPLASSRRATCPARRWTTTATCGCGSSARNTARSRTPTR